MKQNIRTNQTGYALMLMVLALMGVGGVVIAGFTHGVKQEAEHEHYLHNQRVLREAKQALLQYAYNYPITNNLGPGRLPNADNDNDGISDGGLTFGRLPWAQPNLNLYDIRDADGQRLWYAVSSSFRSQATQINSGTSGTITLRDQTGTVIFDGTNPAGLTQYGVAAVIIAPGAVRDRNGVSQDRSVANGDDPFDHTASDGTDKDTDPGIKAPSNYLDLVVDFEDNGTEDNSGFTNGSATDGLILGPVRNLTNDQFIVITAAEVIEMAEKATLQAYRTAINNYLDILSSCTGAGANRDLCEAGGGTWNSVYPWLYNYRGVNTVAELSDFYPADADFGANPNYHDDNGRIPSIFGTYFNRSNSAEVADEITITLSNDYAAMPGTVTSENSGNLSFFNGALADSVRDLTLVSDFLPVGFSSAATTPNARLNVTLPGPGVQTISQVLYFWDDDTLPGSENGYWTICPDNNGNNTSEISDCHRPGGGMDNGNMEEILRVEIEIVMGEVASDGKLKVAFDADYASDAIIAITPPTVGSHAIINASGLDFDDLDIDPDPAPTITASYQIDRHYHAGDPWPFDIEESGDLDVAELLAGATLTVEMRYFPEIPRWAFTNDWHNSIRMAYAEDYRPGVVGDCNVAPDDDCLKINPSQGGPRDKRSLLLISREHGWEDDGADGFTNDLEDVFDDGNHNGNTTYYTRRGNDRVLVIDEL